jgi:rRNA biogenesis protein RRP5
MAPIKRKGNAPEENNARQPQKRAKVGAEEGKKDHKKPEDGTSTAAKASELSVLRDDEPSFPRGGASVLTALERKQIQIQANRDVLFEQKAIGDRKSSQKKPAEDMDEESDNDVEMEDEETTTTTKKSRKKKSKSKKPADKGTDDKQDVRIEGLSFKVRPKNLLLPYESNDCSVLYPEPWSSVKFLVSMPTTSPFRCPTTSLVTSLLHRFRRDSKIDSRKC